LEIVAPRLAVVVAASGGELEEAGAEVARVWVDPGAGRAVAVAGEAVAVQAVAAGELAPRDEGFLVEPERLGGVLHQRLVVVVGNRLGGLTGAIDLRVGRGAEELAEEALQVGALLAADLLHLVDLAALVGEFRRQVGVLARALEPRRLAFRLDDGVFPRRVSHVGGIALGIAAGQQQQTEEGGSAEQRPAGGVRQTSNHWRSLLGPSPGGTGRRWRPARGRG